MFSIFIFTFPTSSDSPLAFIRLSTGDCRSIMTHGWNRFLSSSFLFPLPFFPLHLLIPPCNFAVVIDLPILWMLQASLFAPCYNTEPILFFSCSVSNNVSFLLISFLQSFTPKLS